MPTPHKGPPYFRVRPDPFDYNSEDFTDNPEVDTHVPLSMQNNVPEEEPKPELEPVINEKD